MKTCCFCRKVVRNEQQSVKFNKEIFHTHCLPLKQKQDDHYERIAFIHKELRLSKEQN